MIGELTSLGMDEIKHRKYILIIINASLAKEHRLKTDFKVSGHKLALFQKVCKPLSEYDHHKSQ